MSDDMSLRPMLFTTAPQNQDRTGWVTGPPDFVGVGAMKSGTTWLHAQLMAHPEIHDIGQKELHFFDWFFDQDFTDDHIDTYHRRFPRPPGMLAGEFTPRYMSDVTTPPLLARAAPDTRVLAMLRNPVTRVDSHMRWPNIGQEMLVMFKAADAVNRCHYHSQLQHLLRYFSREQVLVLQYEQIARDPRALYRRALAHIGVDDLDFLPTSIDDLVLENPNRATGLFNHSCAALVEYLRPEVERVAADFGDDIDISLWPDFSEPAR